MPKVGDMIKCHDEEDVKRTLKDLSDQGYGAVRMWPFWIQITKTNEEGDTDAGINMR